MLKRSLCLVTAVVLLPVLLPIITFAVEPAVREKTMIPVAAVNHAPVARNQSVRTAEDRAKVIRLRATDADSNPLTYTIISGPAQGTLAGAPPRVTYTPNPNYYGPDTFTFKTNDGSVDSNVATVSIVVTSVNDAPAALNQNVTTYENTALAITLSGTDVEGNPLTYRIVSKPSRGKLTGSGSNQTYTPNINYRGPDRFTFKVNDGKAGSNIATVSITVMPMNQAPVAQEQSVTADEDTAESILLMAADGDGDSLIYSVVAQPAHGMLTGTPPNVTYTPAGNYSGSDSFTFKANDGKVDSNVATVTILVTAVNDPPVAQNQSVTTDEDTPKAITLVATDVNSDPLIYQIVTHPSHGALSGAPPSVTYTPTANYNGSDSFTFKANDGKVDSNVATVSIAVTAVNDAPVAQNQSVTTVEDTPKPITIMATDVDGDSLTYHIVTQPSHGTLTGTPPQVTYTGAAHYCCSDSFTFNASDGKLDSNVATVTISVTHVNHQPLAQDQSVTTTEDVPKTIVLVATDIDGDSLSYQVVAQPVHGMLSGTPPNVTYTPAAHYLGSDSFTFNANDGKVDTNTATVSLTIASDTKGKTITTMAGNGAPGYSGDDGSATEARLFYPRGVAADISGNLYIADRYNSRIRKVYTNGIITTVAGGGIMRTDGGPAIEAVLFQPIGVAVDVSNNIYIVEQCRIRKVDTDGIISTVAGSTCGYSGDGGPATQAQLAAPSNVTVDVSGNLYIADLFRLRKVDTNGIITTVAGTGNNGYGGDGGPATEAAFGRIEGVAFDFIGNLYLADRNERIRKVDTNGIITTIAGNGVRGYEGDGGPATEAKLYRPLSVAADASGNLYIADEGNNCIRKVDTNGIITTIAGNGIEGYGGDDGPGPLAQLRYPAGVTTDAFGNLYIADQGNNRIRLLKEVFIPKGTFDIIITVAGNGTPGYSGDGSPSTEAQLNRPTGVAVDASNNLYIADYLNHRVRKVDTNSIITTVAGNGTAGYSGDGGSAPEAELNYPLGVAVDGLGNLYISDKYNNCIRRVDSNGIITTVAGNGDWDYSGDGGPATQAQLNVSDRRGR